MTYIYLKVKVKVKVDILYPMTYIDIYIP